MRQSRLNFVEGALLIAATHGWRFQQFPLVRRVAGQQRTTEGLIYRLINWNFLWKSTSSMAYVAFLPRDALRLRLSALCVNLAQKTENGCFSLRQFRNWRSLTPKTTRT